MRGTGDKYILTEHEAPIRFAETMKTDSGLDSKGKKAEKIKITVRRNRNQGDARTNIIEKSFKEIANLRNAGVDFIWNYEAALSHSIRRSNVDPAVYISSRWTNIRNFLNEREQKKLLTNIVVKAAEQLDPGNDIYRTSTLESILKAMKNANQSEPFDLIATFYLSRALWYEPEEAYNRQMDYFKNKILKPFDFSLEEFAENMRILASWTKYLPPPHKNSGDNPLDSNIVEWRKITNPISEDDIRKAIHNALPESMQNDLKTTAGPHGYLSDRVTDDEFIRILNIVQEKDNNAKLEKHKARTVYKAEKKASKIDSNKNKGGKNDTKKTKSSPTKKTPKCLSCYNDGKPEKVYMSHTVDNCKNKTKNNDNVRTASSNNNNNSQKQNKRFVKEMKALQAELDTLKKAASNSTDPAIRQLFSAKRKTDEVEKDSSSDSMSDSFEERRTRSRRICRVERSRPEFDDSFEFEEDQDDRKPAAVTATGSTPEKAIVVDLEEEEGEEISVSKSPEMRIEEETSRQDVNVLDSSRQDEIITKPPAQGHVPPRP